MITEAELDRALEYGKVSLTRPNTRPIRCARAGCGKVCAAGEAFRLWIDGHKRGYLCRGCHPKKVQRK